MTNGWQILSISARRGEKLVYWWINPVFQFILRHHFHQFMLFPPSSQFPPSLTQNHVELLQSFLLHLILNDGLELLAEIFFSRCETKENYLSEFITTFLASNIQERDWTFERKARNTVKCKKGENLTKRMERKLSNWISCAWKCVKSSWLLAAG